MGLVGPQEAFLERDLQWELEVVRCRWPGGEAGGKQQDPNPRQKKWPRGGAALHFSDLAGYQAQLLLVFLVSGGCLLSSGEKDVKLIPTLIKQPPD